MDPVKFEQYSVVKNSINKALCVVIRAAGDNVTVHSGTGDRMTFKAQYLEPATAEEAETLGLLISQLKKDEESRKSAPGRVLNPEQVRIEFDKFLKHIAIRYPASAEAFRTFWNELLAIAGDQPGKTWEMKPNTSSNPCPVLKVLNPSTNKWVYCLSLLGGYGLRMEMKKEFLPEGREALFPIDHAMFGAGRAVELGYKSFTPEKRAPYLDCVREIYKKHPAA